MKRLNIGGALRRHRQRVRHTDRKCRKRRRGGGGGGEGEGEGGEIRRKIGKKQLC